MAKLPTIAALGPRPVPRSSRAIGVVKGAESVGRAVEQLGSATVGVGEVIHEREATALATERDVMVSDQLRDMLYNPETGFMSLNGQAAVNAEPQFMEKLDGMKATAMDGLNNTAKRKLEAQLEARLGRARQSADMHTMGERDNWLDGATAARIESAYQDSLVDPAATAAALATIESETRAKGVRLGWGQEELSGELDKAKSTVFVGQISRIASTDPVLAMQYLRENEGKMRPSDVATLELKLQPEIDLVIGNRIGAAAATGDLPYYNHNTSIEYDMGPARPNAPNKPVLDVIGKSVEDVLGVGARVVVTSGQEGDNPQHGSNRHKTGNAADVAIYRPDGTRVAASDPEMVRIAQAAADNGAKGVGFGIEYMGGQHIHIDLVVAGKGQANTWGSGGAAIRDDIVTRIGNRDVSSTGGLESILNDPSLTERQRTAAIRSYERHRTLAEREKTEAEDANSKALFQKIEGGGSVDDLPVDVRQSLAGPVMAAARTYERSVSAGEVIQTDSQTYVDLTDQAVSDPAGFIAANPMLWRNDLDNADFEHFINMQAKMKAGTLDKEYKGPAPATLRSEAAVQLAGAGYEQKDNLGLYANIESQMIRWAAGNPDAANDPLARNDQINRMLIPVITDEGYLSKEKTRPIGGFDFDGSTPDDDDDLSQGDINRLIGAGGLNIAGQDVTQDDAANVYINLLAILNSTTVADVDLNDASLRQPTAKQLIEGLGAFYR